MPAGCDPSGSCRLGQSLFFGRNLVPCHNDVILPSYTGFICCTRNRYARWQPGVLASGGTPTEFLSLGPILGFARFKRGHFFYFYANRLTHVAWLKLGLEARGLSTMMKFPCPVFNAEECHV
jgi:hypothetical protein